MSVACRTVGHRAARTRPVADPDLCSRPEVIENVEHAPFRDDFSDVGCDSLFARWRLVAGISRDGGVVVIEQLGCNPVDNVRLRFPVACRF